MPRKMKIVNFLAAARFKKIYIYGSATVLHTIKFERLNFLASLAPHLLCLTIMLHTLKMGDN